MRRRGVQLQADGAAVRRRDLTRAASILPARPATAAAVPAWLKGLTLLLLVRVLAAGAYRSAMADVGVRGLDHDQYHRAAVRLAAGRDLYLATPGHLYDDPFPYSPYLAFLFRPLIGQGQLNSYRVWLAIGVACVAASAGLMAHVLARGPGTAWPLAILFLLTGFRYWPTVVELSVGNVHCELLLLVCGMAWAAAGERWTLVAVLVAVAAMLKTWMIGFAVVPVLAGRYRAAAAAVAAAGGLWLAAFAVVGFRQLPMFVAAMRMYAVQPAFVTLSAPGVAKQFFSATGHVRPLVVSPALHVLAVVAAVAAVAASAAVVRRRPNAGDGPLLVAWCGCAALILLTLCHLVYFVLLLPAEWALLAAPLYLHRRPGLVCGGAGAAAYLLLSSATPTLTPVAAWAQAGPARLLTAVPLAAAAVAMAGITLALLRPRPTPPDAE